MKSNIMAAITFAVFTAVAVSPAQAKPKHYKTAPQAIIVCNQQGCSDNVPTASRQTRQVAATYDVAYEGTVVGGRPAGCPWRYCGCGVSLKVFGKIIPELNLAINWVRKFPRTSPAPGMVAARSGHVFYIQSVNGDGTVIAFDPNSGGHKTRVHTVSLRGYHVVDPHGSRIAMNTRN